MNNTMSLSDLSFSARMRAIQLFDKHGNVFALKARRGHQLTSLVVDKDEYEREKKRLIKDGWLEVIWD